MVTTASLAVRVLLANWTRLALTEALHEILEGSAFYSSAWMHGFPSRTRSIVLTHYGTSSIDYVVTNKSSLFLQCAPTMLPVMQTNNAAVKCVLQFQVPYTKIAVKPVGWIVDDLDAYLHKVEDSTNPGMTL